MQFKTGGDLISFSAPKVKMVMKMKFFRAMDRRVQRSGPSSWRDPVASSIARPDGAGLLCVGLLEVQGVFRPPHSPGSKTFGHASRRRVRRSPRCSEVPLSHSKGVVRSAFGGTASSSSSTFSENLENSRATMHGRIGVLSRSTVQLTSHSSSVMFWMLMVLVNGTSSSSCVDR